MSPPTKPSWKTARGDEWWWTGTPALVGSLFDAIGVFSIDNPFAGTAEQLRAVLQATAAQFPHLQIHCMYDNQTRHTLDELQQTGHLRWADVGNPYSAYAAIDLAPSHRPTAANDPATDPAQDEEAPPEHTPAQPRRALPTVAAFVIGLLFLIRGALVLLRGIAQPYGYSRPDDLFFGVVAFPLGLLCLALALHLRRSRPRREAPKPHQLFEHSQ